MPQVDDSKNKLIELLNNVIKTAKGDLETLQSEHSQQISCIGETDDIVKKFIAKIKQNSGTNGFSMLELVDIYEEGEKRYKYKRAGYQFSYIKDANLEPGTLTIINRDFLTGALDNLQ